ncbi:MAG: MCE family protein [Gammaproteobacteria bacterium]|nr:MCE family protein [Gammaproteobacteria bacterium]
MTEPPSNAEALPEAYVDDSRRISLVWLIPLVTLLAAAWLGYHTYSQRGPLVTIVFETAEGLEADRTRVNFKDVDIGVVETISLSPDLKRVLVEARLRVDIEPYLNDRTRFWVVRPRLSSAGISGLETLVGGTYIAADLATGGVETDRFEGLEAPPTVSASDAGRTFRLRSQRLGSLRVGSPVHYLGIEVGRVVDFQLAADGGVTLHVFVDAPHDRRVREHTRFWNASGVNVRFDADGLSVTADSLATVLLGGIAFGDPGAGGDSAAAEEMAEFTLHADEQAAFATRFALREAWELDFVGSVRGLTAGAPVEFRGIRIGEVVDVALEIADDRRSTRVPVRIAIEPERMGIRPDAGHSETIGLPERALWDELVRNGLRAQLKTGNLLAGALYVDLDFYPEDEVRTIDWQAEVPALPTVPTPLDELRTLLARLGKLPLDDMAADLAASLAALHKTMNATNALLRRLDRETATELDKTLTQTRSTLVTLERFLKPNSPLQVEAQRALQEFGSAARSLRIMADYLERHPEALIRGKGGN